MSDKLSLGIGVSDIYTIMEQKIAIRQGAPDPARDGLVRFENLTDWAFQGVLGLTYEFSDRLRLGIVYRSEADTDLEGDIDIQGLRIPLAATPRPTSRSAGPTPSGWTSAWLQVERQDRSVLQRRLAKIVQIQPESAVIRQQPGR